MGRVFANGPGDRGSIPGRVIPKTWSNSGKRVAPSPISWCSSYWKESLRGALDYGRQLYLLYFIGLLNSVRRWPERLGFNPGLSHYQRLKKWYLISLCLTLSIIRYVSRVKWSNHRKWEAPFPIPRCSSYWEGRLLLNWWPVPTTKEILYNVVNF